MKRLLLISLTKLYCSTGPFSSTVSYKISPENESCVTLLRNTLCLSYYKSVKMLRPISKTAELMPISSREIHTLAQLAY